MYYWFYYVGGGFIYVKISGKAFEKLFCASVSIGKTGQVQ